MSAASDTVEDMDCSEAPGAESKVPGETCVGLFVELLTGPQPQKLETKLEKALQSWSNNKKLGKDFEVVSLKKDGRAVIKIKPPPALGDLQELCGEKLNQVKDGIVFTIKDVFLTPLGAKTQKADPTVEIADASMTHPPPSFMPQQTDVEEQFNGQNSDVNSSTGEIPPQLETQSADNPLKTPLSSVTNPQNEFLVEQSGSSAAVPTSYSSTISVSDFWYLYHTYNEEMDHIMKKNDVQIQANVTVTFPVTSQLGNPKKALSEFEEVVKKWSEESSGKTVPFKNRDPEEWKNLFKRVERKENRLLVTLSSENVIICGPSQILNADMKPCAKDETSTWASQDTPPKIGMNIKDPLLDNGLLIEMNYWRLIESFQKDLTRIKDRFGVDFKATGISQDKVEVNAHYRGLGKNESMESHALRALLRLYQKTATSPLNLTQHPEAMRFRGPPGTSTDVYVPEGASGSPLFNGQSGYNTHDTGAPTGEGAAAGDKNEETCPICFEPFTKKTTLKCKHEFCDECLARSKESMGPVCPLCKDVFGEVKGDQPDGTMEWKSGTMSLRGYPGCGHITITYYIPGGIQTKRHPNPGKYYEGVSRRAYLPDNKEGNEVLQLLRRAFDKRLIFTVGTSRTTGRDNQVTWNDIHHKTSMEGGPQCFGYPDPHYLSRVKEELKAKGIE